MSPAEARMHELARLVLEGDDLERRLALNLLLQIALATARAEDEASGVERPTLELVPRDD